MIASQNHCYTSKENIYLNHTISVRTLYRILLTMPYFFFIVSMLHIVGRQHYSHIYELHLSQYLKVL